ncbi:MAG: 7-carboxy-7-deazaguanine synthase QueE [Deltaproteobacteria bacterium]|nr:7-carboxy-7-deazaguanine synthase QueE [Deltaproteobacteria bacterium]MBW2417735.1 7-carboxy-7-deazaguanine synthase QueE [Deltaproteobacteria bacterium]
MDANLVEIFSSIQGEGLHLGASTLFVRFGGCDLRCAWCDSPNTWRPASRCSVECEPGTGRFESIANPVSLAQIERRLAGLGLEEHRFVSLTGGEPLLQPDAVGALVGSLRGARPRVLLETHGLAVDAMAGVAEQVDVVSMDWKLTSDVRRAADPRSGPVERFHEEHERFLHAAGGAGELIVKVVVSANTREQELDEVTARIAAFDPATPLILQPLTPAGRVREKPTAAQLISLLRRCENVLQEVRVIPQTHKSYGAH